ncbi:MAG: HAMP domain-containing sensor histidine kinase [Planctomycetota bacterium]
MKGWSLARRSALWFGGLLLVLLLALVGCSYWMISSYMNRELDKEVEELGRAAASQLAGASPSEAKAMLEVLVEEGHDLGVGFVLRRDDGEVLSGRSELAHARPDDVEAWAWRTGSVSIADGSTLLVGIDGAGRAEELDELPGAMALAATLFAGIAALAGWLFGRRMSALLSQVADTVDPAGASTPHGAPREISALVDAINSGFARAEAAQSRSRHLIVGAAHALRSPIQALLSQAQSTLRKERDVERYRETLEGQEQELTEFARSVDNLVAFCAESGGPYAAETFDLMSELRLRLHPDMDRARRSQLGLRLNGPDSLLVEAERESLVLAVRNLVSNALSVSRDGQQVDIEVEAHADRVRVTVDDQGPGVPEADRERVFEPMRRGSTPGPEAQQAPQARGRACYGLGLALVRRAMDDHGGRAWIESAPGGGARVRLEFRAVREGAAPREELATL